jgi:hypothetical protein
LISARGAALFGLSPYGAVGVHVAFLTNHDNPPPETDTELLANLMVGAEARGILPIEDGWSLWAGFSVGYSHWMRYYEVQSEDMATKIEARMNGVFVGGGLGGDYFFFENLAVGVGFYIYKPFYWKRCQENGGGRACEGLSDQDKEKIGIYWDVGATITYFYEM